MTAPRACAKSATAFFNQSFCLVFGASHQKPNRTLFGGGCAAPNAYQMTWHMPGNDSQAFRLGSRGPPVRCGLAKTVGSWNDDQLECATPLRRFYNRRMKSNVNTCNNTDITGNCSRLGLKDWEAKPRRRKASIKKTRSHALHEQLPDASGFKVKPHGLLLYRITALACYNLDRSGTEMME